MKYILLFASCFLILPYLMHAEQLPESWYRWESQVLEGTRNLELDSLIVKDLDENRREIQSRNVPRFMAVRSLSQPHEALPDNMAIEMLPELFFTIPWNEEGTAFSRVDGNPGTTLITLTAQLEQVVNGELLFETDSGLLIETRISFNGQLLPSITVGYSHGRISTMTILSEADKLTSGAVYREALFIYR